MRGKVSMPSHIGMKSRITPAYAGKSTKELWLNITYKDHPRICGEKEKIMEGKSE